MISTKAHGKNWKPLAAVAVVAAVLAVAAYALTRPSGEEGETASEENVWVQYTASFKLLSTSDNGPIENLALGLPYPHILGMTIEPLYENFSINFIPGGFGESTPLFTPVPETPSSIGENWVVVVAPFWLTTPIPNALLLASELSVGDEFQIEAYLKVLERDLEKLTLINYFSENGEYYFLSLSENSALAFCNWSSDKTIGLEITTQMMKEVKGETYPLENWVGEINENVPHESTIKLRKVD